MFAVWRHARWQLLLTLVVGVVLSSIVVPTRPPAAGAQPFSPGGQDIVEPDSREVIEAHDLYRRRFPVNVTGRVMSQGSPLEGAHLVLGTDRVESGVDGVFQLDGIERRNHMMTVDADDHYPRVIGVMADLEAETTSIDIGDISLVPDGPGRHSMVFGGDVSLGRRFLDPSEIAPLDSIPEPDPEALISAPTAKEDTLAVLHDYAAMIEPYDFVSLNLETVVTDDPADPQATQQFIFFTLPESVEAIAEIGVDYVSLGNNHVWDYGEQGISDTHAVLDELGLDHSGSGANADEAFTPEIIAVGEEGLMAAMHSWVATRNLGSFYPPHATETKGGAASAHDFERMTDALARTEEAGHLSIAQLHVGYEYTERPAESDPDQLVQERFALAVDAGADLVVGHHPHVPQGFEYRDGVLVAHSLGNLAFDQLRLDTFYGVMLAVVFEGDQLVDARVEPVYLDDNEPTIATGEPGDHLLCQLSFVGAPDVVLVPDGGAGLILPRSETERSERTVEVDLEPDADGVAMVDLRDIRHANESVGWVDGVDLSQVSLGRDLMMLGDMEDHDLDDELGQVSPWYHGSSTFVCGAEARRGTGALCSIRTPGNIGPASIYFGRRVRVQGDRINQPNRDLTVLVYESGQNRGELVVNATYWASQEEAQFGTEQIGVLAPRTGDYQAHWLPVHMPEEDMSYIEALPENRPFRMTPQLHNPRAIRLSIEHHPTVWAPGLAAIDDVALISWNAPVVVDDEFRTPNPYDFLRITDVAPGETISITLHSYRTN